MNDENLMPAFPVQDASKWQAHGMTLRDYFAAQTLVGAFNSPGFTDGFTFEEKAAWVYQMADAMLEVRNLK